MRITSEELFDILHIMSNQVEIEIHGIENGQMKSATDARERRHMVLDYLLGDNSENSQRLCELKHHLSERMEWMELASKWYTRNKDIYKEALKKVDEVSEKIIEILNDMSKNLKIEA